MSKENGEGKEYASPFDEWWFTARPFTVEQAKSHLRLAYEQGVARTRPIMLVGESGIGKNHLLEQLAADLKIDYFWFPCKGILPEDFRMPLPNKSMQQAKEYPGDINGLVALIKDYFAVDHEYTYTMVESVKKIFEPGYRAIAHFDELMQALKEIKQILYILGYDRRFDDMQVSENVMIVFSGNPPQEAQYQLAQLDHATIDRMFKMKIIGTQREWIDWARKNDINSLVIDFVEDYPQAFDINKGRRLHYLHDWLTPYGDLNPDNLPENFLGVVQGCIDIENSVRFMNFVREVYEVNGMALLEGNKKAFDRLKTIGSSPAKAIRLSKIHRDIHAALSNPQKHLKGVWEKEKTNAKRYSTVAANLLKYAEIMKVYDLDTVVGLLYKITQIGNDDLERALDKEFKKDEHNEIALGVLECVSQATASPNGLENSDNSMKMHAEE